MDKMIIKEIQYDWYFTPEGEEYKKYRVGSDGVSAIVEHRAQGDGDKWFYDVHFEDGRVERIFNINKVILEPKK
jgi:hypothetical protein